jgi:hypothetical protein
MRERSRSNRSTHLATRVIGPLRNSRRRVQRNGHLLFLSHFFTVDRAAKFKPVNKAKTSVSPTPFVRCPSSILKLMKQLEVHCFLTCVT